MIGAARIRSSARHCLWFAGCAWGLGSFALASCASGAADELTGGDGPEVGDAGGTPGPSAEESGPRSLGADSASDDLAEAASYGDDQFSNSGPDVTNGGDDAGIAVDAFASTPDVNVPDASAPDTGSSDGGVASSDASGSVACGGIPAWFAGTTATLVQNLGSKYTCLVEGWCSESNAAGVAAYEPGTGWAWTTAWQDDGSCPAGSNADP